MFNETFETLKFHANQYLHNLINKWQSEQNKNWQEFDSIYKTSLKQDLKRNEISSSEWKITTNLFLNTSRWIKNYEIHPEQITEFYAIWLKQFDSVINTVSDHLESEIDDYFWIKKGHDSLYISFWKFISRRKHKFLAWSNKFNNLFRRILKKEILPLKSIRKKISVHSFFKFYFNLSFLPFLYGTWQKYLKFISMYLAEIHHQSEEIFLTLHTDENFKKGLKGQNKNIKEVLESQRELFTQNVRYQSRFAEFKNQIETDFSEYLFKAETLLKQKWELAGTFVLPDTKYNPARFDSRLNKYLKKYAENIRLWNEHLSGEKNDWLKDTGLSALQLISGQLCYKTISTLEQKLNDLSSFFDEPSSLVEKTLDDLNNTLPSNKELFSDKIFSISRTTVRKLHREKLPQLADNLINAQFNKHIENYLSLLDLELEKLPEEYTIFSFRDSEGMPPESKFIDIEFKDLITDEIYTELQLSIKPLFNMLDEKTKSLVRSVAENDQIIELNFETALELSGTEDISALEKAYSVALDGLRRASQQLRSLQNEMAETINHVIDSIVKNTLYFEQRIQNLSDNEKIIHLKLLTAKTKSREKIKKTADNLKKHVKRALPQLVEITVKGFKHLQKIYLRIRKITGMTVSPEGAEEILSRFLFQIKNQLKSLPYVYQRLFRFQPLEDERFFTGREVQMEQLKNQFENWKKGEFSVTALIGEKGSGRTTLLNFAESQFYHHYPLIKVDLLQTVYKEKDVFHILNESFALPDCNNFYELEQKINENEKQYVCVLENLHKMFLRIIAGFEALERFLLFLSNTHQKVHWVITCGVYGWNYLDRVIHISRFFQRLVFLPEFEVEVIKNVILKRHRVSGYNLHFEATEEISRNRKFKKLADDQKKQEFLNNIFFEQLNKLSDGNISVAILFWLCAIKEIKDDTLIVSPVVEFEMSVIHRISEDLFNYAAFLQHETLTPEYHALIFNQSNEKSNLIFNRLKNKGILTGSDSGYQIHYLLYRPVVKALKINNLL